MKTLSIPLWGRGAFALTLLSLSAGQLYAAEKTYQYYMFRQTKLRNDATANSIQLSEFQLKLAGGNLDLNPVIVTNPGGNNPVSGNENPDKVKDGFTTTKWLDFNKKELVFTFPAPTTIDGYNFATANDGTERDPVSWIFYGSTNGTDWIPLDMRNDVAVTTTRQTHQPNNGWIIPENSPAPFVRQFSTNRSVAINGSTNVTATWDTLLGDSVTLTGVPGTLPAKSVTPQALTLPDNAETVFTLTATSAQGTGTSSVTVRTIPSGGTASFRFVRFTPTKLRTNTTPAVQLAEFDLKSGITPIGLLSAQNEAGGVSPGAESPAQLIDNNVATKWLNSTRGAVIIELDDGNLEEELPVTFDSYSFTTANDAIDRDPVRWMLEGSNDAAGPWTLIDNLTTFDVQVPTTRQVVSQDFPLAPVSTVLPVAMLSGETKVVAGEPITLVWSTSGAASVEINGVPGPLEASGSVDVTPAADTTYTLTATSSASAVMTASLVVDVITPAITTIDYANFNGSGEELALIGQASVLNDFANRPAPADANRLRITPDQGSSTGAAWFRKRVDTSAGFETEFDLHLVNLLGPNPGADGMAFVIHNDPRRTQAFPTVNHENGLPSNALNICFDSHFNGAPETSAAAITVREGNILTATVDLQPSAKLPLGGTPEIPDMSQTVGTAAPYRVRVGYLPPTESTAGDLDVYINGMLVIDSLQIDLQGVAQATDENGLAYVGFTARTGGFFEAHDVTSWSFFEGAPAPPFMLLSSTVTTGASPSVALQWGSGGPHTYKITSSTDMLDWSNIIQQNIQPSGTGVNNATVNIPSGDRVFIRVEEE